MGAAIKVNGCFNSSICLKNHFIPCKKPEICYINRVTSVTMAINAVQNRRFGPGGRTRRVHQAAQKYAVWWARISFDRRDKGMVFARYDTTDFRVNF